MSFDRCDRCGKPWANHTTACDFGQTTLTFALPPAPDHRRYDGDPKQPYPDEDFAAPQPPRPAPESKACRRCKHADHDRICVVATDGDVCGCRYPLPDYIPSPPPPPPASGEVHTPDCIARARVRPDRPFCTCNPTSPSPASGESYRAACGHLVGVEPRENCFVNSCYNYKATPSPPPPASDPNKQGRMSEEEFEREFDSDRFYNAYHAASRLIDEARRAREYERASQVGWRSYVAQMSGIVAAKDAQIATLRGAAQADEERLRAAAEKAGVTWFGCDTPDHMADEIAALRAEAAQLREALSALWKALSALYEECKIIREKREPFGGIAPHPDTMAQAAATLKEKP